IQGALDGNALAQRTPTARLIVKAPTEDISPSAVAAESGMAVAYIALTHGEGFRARPRVPKAPESFDFLAVPSGGDRLMFTELKGGQWTAPEALTAPGGDLYRTAMAVDGEGRVWVFWSANVEGNWDVFGRARTGAQWGQPVRISAAAGSDVHVAATADSAGRVWVAWQGFREGHSDIFTARQDGAGFGPPERVGGGPANKWTPALAASADGRVAVAWDTYERGNYDVVVRVRQGDAWQAPRLAAAALQNEARPALAYDRQNRLWIAYEISPEGWGKDFGPYDQSPKRTALYRQRAIGVRVLAQGRLHAPPGDLTRALPTPQGTRRWPKAPKNAILAAGPRLAVDAAGRVWLTARIKMGSFISGAGTSWATCLTTCDAVGWRPATIVPNSDGLLHETPALAPAANGGLRIVSACDGRMRTAAFWGEALKMMRRRSKSLPPASTRAYGDYPDKAVNWEIAVADVGATAAPKPIALTPLPDEAPRGPSPDAAREAKHVAAVRAYRAQVAGKTVQILRGEFHRHTELSSDGGGDGTLLDMWRYGIDMAALDWIGNGDHDNGARELPWWLTQKTTDMFQIAGAFTPMYTYERSCRYPDGHRNAVFAQRGVRPLPRLAGGLGKALDDLPPDAKRPNTPDTQMFYRYLRQFDGICASHTSGTDMGTDWRDTDPKVEPIVEIYQGDRQNYEAAGAPRANTADYSLGGWRPLGFVSRALLKGARLGFQSSSDHISTHMSYCCVYVEARSRSAILTGMKRRHIYGATDNIIADVRCGEHFMGDEFTVTKPPTLRVKLIGTAPFARVVIVKDNKHVYTVEPGKASVEFEWTDRDAAPGATSYYYVRGEQVGQDATRKVKSLSTGKKMDVTVNNGELVWASPMWITYRP
ncbi:hypothetical protein HQ560_14220, partial [bacterium]|nr:hypothetical protein [bacterium]